MLTLTFFCLFLVMNSALTINEFVHMLTLFIAMCACFGLAYLSRFFKKHHVLINGRRQNTYSLMLALLLVCAFVQTFFWVIDPDSGIHEPRSVFILTTAGIIAFFRQQTEKIETVPKAAENTGEVVSK